MQIITENLELVRYISIALAFVVILLLAPYRAKKIKNALYLILPFIVFVLALILGGFYLHYTAI